MNKVNDRFFRNDNVSMNNFDSIKYGATSSQQKDGFTNGVFGLRHRHVLKSPSLPVRLFGSQCRMIPSVTDRCSGTDFTSQAQEPSRPARKQRTTPCGVESTWTHRTRKPNTLEERQESKRTYSIRLETVPRNCSKNTQPCQSTAHHLK